MERNEYLSYRLAAIQGANEEIGKYGRYVFVLASGAIALSVSFSDQIAGSAHPRFPVLLAMAWLWFLCSLLSIVLSHLLAFKAHSFDIDKIDDLYEAAGKLEWTDDNQWNKWTKRTNWLSLAFFTLGAVFLVSFAYCNIGR